MFCTNCGKQVPDDARFCVYCGSNLVDDVIEIKAQENNIAKDIPNNQNTKINDYNNQIPNNKNIQSTPVTPIKNVNNTINTNNNLNNSVTNSNNNTPVFNNQPMNNGKVNLNNNQPVNNGTVNLNNNQPMNNGAANSSSQSLNNNAINSAYNKPLINNSSYNKPSNDVHNNYVNSTYNREDNPKSKKGTVSIILGIFSIILGVTGIGLSFFSTIAAFIVGAVAILFAFFRILIKGNNVVSIIGTLIGIIAIVLNILVALSIVNFPIKNSKDFNINGTWESKDSQSFEFSDDGTYIFGQDKETIEDEYFTGDYSLISGKEGLEKAGYSNNKIKAILDECGEENIITIKFDAVKYMSDGTEKTIPDKYKSKYYVFIIADNYNLSGVDVNEETKCYISKEK